jgi:hypothetical protein
MQPNLEKQEYRGRENLSSRFFEVETVSDPLRTPNTPLKQGVNEKRRPWRFSRYEISG